MTSGAPDYTTSISITTEIGGIEVSVPAAQSYWKGKTKRYEDTSFTEDITLDVYTDLERYGHDGYVVNDGDGNITVEVEDPDEGWGGTHTLKKDEVLDLYMLNVKQIRLTHVTDSAYRILVI